MKTKSNPDLEILSDINECQNGYLEENSFDFDDLEIGPASMENHFRKKFTSHFLVGLHMQTA